jgi:cell shape-determining protein MreD
MARTLLWIALGYVSCLWDCSAGFHDPRWPSATGVFLALLVMQWPKCGLWGAALCGLVLDAAHGGILGPRVLGGVIATSVVSHFGLHRSDTRWPRSVCLIVSLIALWLAVPLITAGVTGSLHFNHWTLAQSIATTTLSTTLIVLAVRVMMRTEQIDRED